MESVSSAFPEERPGDAPARGGTATPGSSGTRAFPGWPRVTPLRAVLASALLAMTLALPSLGHDFVYDDRAIVEEREAVHEADFGVLLTDTYWPEERGSALWRPGALLAYSGQWALGGGSPLIFHGVNVLLYALVAGLVALLAASLFTPGVGLAAGTLFAAHPVHVEVFANVVGQAELISASCYLGALLLAWRSASAGRAAHAALPAVVLVGVLTLVGIATKEHVVTLPGALLVLWWLASVRSGEPIGEVARRQWPILVAILLPIAIYLLARARILGGVADSGGLAPGLDPDSALRRFAVMLPVSLHWLRLLFWPVHLAAEYAPGDFMPRPGFGVIHAVALALWAALLGVVWKLRESVPAVAVGAALFFVTISVVSNVVVPLEILLAERLLFLPSVGWALAVGGLLGAAARASARVFWPVTVSIAVVVLLFSARTLERVPVWSDNQIFFEQMARDMPDSYRLPWIASGEALAAGDTARWEALMREALHRNPYAAGIAEDLGVLHMETGRHETAIPFFIHALEQDMERRGALQGLAISLIRSDRGTEALRWLDWLEELHGGEALVSVLRVEALRGAGRYRESLRVAEDALDGRPGDWNLHLLAAESARLGGLCEDALRHAEEGKARAPENRLAEFDRILEAIHGGDPPCP